MTHLDAKQSSLAASMPDQVSAGFLISIDQSQLEHEIKARFIDYAHLSEVPPRSGVYIARRDRDAGNYFYVGKSENLWKRIKSHFKGARGGNQFCLYVYDKIVSAVSRVTDPDIIAAELTRKLDDKTGEWVRGEVRFSWFELQKEELDCAEKTLRWRLRPTLNRLSEVKWKIHRQSCCKHQGC